MNASCNYGSKFVQVRSVYSSVQLSPDSPTHSTSSYFHGRYWPSAPVPGCAVWAPRTDTFYRAAGCETFRAHRSMSKRTIRIPDAGGCSGAKHLLHCSRAVAAHTIRYDTILYDTIRSYFNVRLKADISQLNLPH